MKACGWEKEKETAFLAPSKEREKTTANKGKRTQSITKTSPGRKRGGGKALQKKKECPRILVKTAKKEKKKTVAAQRGGVKEGCLRLRPRRQEDAAPLPTRGVSRNKNEEGRKRKYYLFPARG